MGHHDIACVYAVLDWNTHVLFLQFVHCAEQKLFSKKCTSSDTKEHYTNLWKMFKNVYRVSFLAYTDIYVLNINSLSTSGH